VKIESAMGIMKIENSRRMMKNLSKMKKKPSKKIIHKNIQRFKKIQFECQDYIQKISDFGGYYTMTLR